MDRNEHVLGKKYRNPILSQLLPILQEQALVDALLRIFCLSFSLRPISSDEEGVRSPWNHNVSMGFDEVPGFLEFSEREFGEFGNDRGHLRHGISIVLLDLVIFFRFKRRSGGGRSNGCGVEDFVFDGCCLRFLLSFYTGGARCTEEGFRFRFGRNIL